MTRPDLPPSRDERIALAAQAILGCCSPDDMMDDGFERCFDNPVLVEFRVLVPTFLRGIDLNHHAADAIMFDSGFAAISYSPPKEVGGGYVCAIRVPVGEPAVKVTAETITDEQIREARDMFPEAIGSETVADALGLPLGPYDGGDLKSRRATARERCAAAWNARHGAAR